MGLILSFSWLSKEQSSPMNHLRITLEQHEALLSILTGVHALLLLPKHFS